MRINVFTCLIGLGLALSLSACTDHRLGGPASPVRLRLKTVQGGGNNNGFTTTVNTTYTYDSQSRLSGITKIDGSLSVISYGDPTNKYVSTAAEANNIFYVYYPNPADQTTGDITRYPYPEVSAGTSFEAIKYRLVNSMLNYGNRLMRFAYTFDNSKRLVGVSQIGDQSNLNTFAYTYTGENITTENATYAAGRDGQYTNTYTYDAKINPFFGLLDPAINDLVRANRNNVVKEVSQMGPTTTIIYEYEYNPQGLPTKQTKKINDTIVETLTFGYEAY